jgi:pimeloyl-ACP methyl ester carboxylesterase
MPARSDMKARPVERRFRTADGVELVADAWGDPTRPPAILLHGGGQTRHAWKRTAAELGRHGYFALSVDLRGHGDSGWSPDGDYPMDRFATDVRTLATQFARKPVLIGASLGGIASLIAEGEAESSIATALVLVDITPRVDMGGVEKIQGFMREHAREGFSSLQEAADVVAAYLPHRPRPRSQEGLKKNLRLHPDGRWRWHWDPQFLAGPHPVGSDRAGVEATLVAAARNLAIPTLLVRGASSELVHDTHVKEFLALVPHAAYADVSGARHMVVGDRNDQFSSAIQGFLDGLER